MGFQKRAILVITEDTREDMNYFKFVWRYSDAEEGEPSIALGNLNYPKSSLKWDLFDKIEKMNVVDITDDERKKLLGEIGTCVWNLFPEKIQDCFNTFHAAAGLAILSEASIPWELAYIPQKSDYMGNLFAVGRIHLVQGIFSQSLPLPRPRSLLIIAPSYDPSSSLLRRKHEIEPSKQATLARQKDLESERWKETISRVIHDSEGLTTTAELLCGGRVERQGRRGIPRELKKVAVAHKGNVCMMLREENTIVLYLGHKARTGRTPNLVEEDRLTAKETDHREPPRTETELRLVDGCLRAQDIDALATQKVVPPSLVLLMTCSAGAAEHLELVDAFIKWGARAVIATNWNVDDNTVSDFVTALFRRLRQNSYSTIGQVFHQTIGDLSKKGNESKLAFVLYGSPLLNMPWNQSPRLELNLWEGVLDMSPNLLPSMIQSMDPGLRVNTKGLSLDELKDRFDNSEESDTKVVSAMPLLWAIEILKEQRSKAKDLRIVGSMFNPTIDSVQVITRKGMDEINTLADLKGRRIAVNRIRMVPTLITAMNIEEEFGLDVKVEEYAEKMIRDSVTFVDFQCHHDTVAALDRGDVDAAVVYWPYLGDNNRQKHKVIGEPQKYLEEHLGMKSVGQVLLTRREDYDMHKKDFAALIRCLNEKVTLAFDAQNQKGIDNFGIFIKGEDVECYSRFIGKIVHLANRIDPKSSQIPLLDLTNVFVTEKQFGPISPLIVRSAGLAEDIAERIVECLVKDKHKGECGLVLYGPPRTGKTTLAKNVYKAAKTKYSKLEIMNFRKNKGEANDSFQRRFQKEVLDFSFQRPTVVIIDEAEIVLGEESPGSADFKAKTDSKEDDTPRMVYYLATTNYPVHLSDGVLGDPDLRPRRLSPYFVGYPNQSERKRIMKQEFKTLELKSDERIIERLAEKSGLRNYDGIKKLCAGLVGKRSEEITNRLIDKLLKEVKEVDVDEQAKADDSRKRFGSITIGKTSQTLF